MRFDPDRILLEHVFQRLTRLLSGRWSCYDLARGCLPGARAFGLCTGAEMVVAQGWTWLPFAILFPALIWWGTALTNNRVNAIEREAACGRINDPYRSSDRCDRYLYLTTVVYVIIGGFFVTPRIYYAGPMFLAWMSAKYFSCCVPHTPSRRTKTFGFIPTPARAAS